ncbi:MAG: hypothetical protein JWP13_466 [Candidatus Saccharibacteria bacterium]|nr:hypothetical protein [Candidatus Saccharibacteria bacterium]
MNSNNKRKKRVWLAVSMVSGVLLVATFILLFYSLTVLNDCLERSFSDISISQGLCTIPGLRTAAHYNWVLVLLIFISGAGLIWGIVKNERSKRQMDEEEDDEPPVEEIVVDSQLPDTHGRKSQRDEELKRR